MSRTPVPSTFFVLLFAFLSLALGIAAADVSPAKIIAVLDGDTVTAILGNGQQREIRLEGIDAPEHVRHLGQNPQPI